MPEGANAATELSREHAAIESMVGRIAELGPSIERTRLVHTVSARFMTHVEAEERYLYPAMRRFLPGGTDEAVGEARQQEAVAHLVESLERTDANDAKFEQLASQLVLDIQRHIEHQDAVLLPALIDACPREEINHLGRQLRGGMSDAREDAEPRAQAQPPADATSGTATTVLDEHAQRQNVEQQAREGAPDGRREQGGIKGLISRLSTRNRRRDGGGW